MIRPFAGPPAFVLGPIGPLFTFACNSPMAPNAVSVPFPLQAKTCQPLRKDGELVGCGPTAKRRKFSCFPRAKAPWR